MCTKWMVKTMQICKKSQYKAGVQEEARNKGAPPPTFEDEPAIPPVSEMDVDSSIKPRGSPT
ncbi:hypothetical protein F2Q70_00038575 [Brassica cretica]|uniref:Uncharacterized protein n=1 Tax=Brassica cretica TaxID=69181 RepID=A0A8S9K9N6_BRACR|nr:hypothetical protein F2Q70_00038575 [Brassica cretica]